MQFHAITCFVALTLLPFAIGPRPSAQADLRARFESLDDKREHSAIVQLWKDNPIETLGLIDSYLEGSLSKLEKDRASDPAVLTAMEARALRGARAADQAFGCAIFADYASSFGSWNAEEQVRFRRGQALFGAASKALNAKNYAEALAKATESLNLARPLGDWWGTAMALGALGQAHTGLGHPLDALECATQARLINHDLRLVQDEYDSLTFVTLAAEALGRTERALTSAEDALALAHQLGHEAGVSSYEQSIARLCAKLAK